MRGFDFAYFDAAVGEVAVARRPSFGSDVDRSRRLLTGSDLGPPPALAVAVALVLLGVRRQLAEFRSDPSDTP